MPVRTHAIENVDVFWNYESEQDTLFWELRGHADTKNIFGGPVRIRFHGKMQCHSKADSRTWTIQSLSLSGV